MQSLRSIDCDEKCCDAINAIDITTGSRRCLLYCVQACIHCIGILNEQRNQYDKHVLLTLVMSIALSASLEQIVPNNEKQKITQQSLTVSLQKSGIYLSEIALRKLNSFMDNVACNRHSFVIYAIIYQYFPIFIGV